MSIKIDMLRCFAHVAQSGNLAEAAARMGRTQSAVSMMLKQFEAHLGARLFEGERKNRLTPTGAQVFEMAQKQVQSFDATVGQIEAVARSPQGLLRVASIPSATGQLIPAAVEAITRAHPGLKVDIRDADTASVIDALVSGQADVGLVSGAPSLNGITRAPLFEDRFGLICAPGHPLATGAGPVELKAVIAAGFAGNNLCQLIDAPQLRAALAETRVHTHNIFTMIGLLQTGKWCTILPQTVAEDLEDGLVFRAIAGLEANRLVSVLLPERSSQRRVADAFAEILRAEVSRLGRAVLSP